MQIYGILLNIRGILLNIRGILLNIRGILLNIRGKSENFGENLGIFEENARKIGEFPRNPFLEVAEPKGDPAVVSGRFRSFLLVIHSFFRSFPVIFRLIPIDSGKSFLFIPFYSSSSSNHPDFML